MTMAKKKNGKQKRASEAAMEKAEASKPADRKEADARKAEIEKKVAALTKHANERVQKLKGVITRHEAAIEKAKAKQESIIAYLEKRANSIREKGDPKTKAMAKLAKLKQKAFLLEQQIAEMS